MLHSKYLTMIALSPNPCQPLDKQGTSLPATSICMQNSNILPVYKYDLKPLASYGLHFAKLIGKKLEPIASMLREFPNAIYWPYVSWSGW